jgi:hypothetical protein
MQIQKGEDVLSIGFVMLRAYGHVAPHRRCSHWFAWQCSSGCLHHDYSRAQPFASASSNTLIDLHNVDDLKMLFDKDLGRFRLVLLLSSTCPVCIAGSRWVKGGYLDQMGMETDHRLASSSRRGL